MFTQFLLIFYQKNPFFSIYFLQNYYFFTFRFNILFTFSNKQLYYFFIVISFFIFLFFHFFLFISELSHQRLCTYFSIIFFRHLIHKKQNQVHNIKFTNLFRVHPAQRAFCAIGKVRELSYSAKKLS